MAKTFGGVFTQQRPIPEAGIEAAVRVMRSGRLHRYNVLPGEVSEAALLEQDFAAWLGVPYCLATTSGGTAMQIALGAVELPRGAKVLTNAFTLSPVPGAIHQAGGVPVLVETTGELVIDIDDLAAKAEASGAKHLLLSHMRGHLADMEAITALCDRAGITMIEDCAHTMGAAWKGRKSGTFGKVACFSTQTYKHLNSGEGGFVTTGDAGVMARAIIRSGSYMLYDRHIAAPGADAFADARLDSPNCSSRMDNLRAAILRPQLAQLAADCEAWQTLYGVLEAELRKVPGLILRAIPNEETHVGSSIQFRAPNLTDDHVPVFVALAASRGVELKWFGSHEPHGYTSRHVSWRYVTEQALPRTDRVLSRLFDMRVPLTFSEADCRLIGAIVGDCLGEIAGSGKAPEEAR